MAGFHQCAFNVNYLYIITWYDHHFQICFIIWSCDVHSTPVNIRVSVLQCCHEHSEDTLCDIITDGQLRVGSWWTAGADQDAAGVPGVAAAPVLHLGFVLLLVMARYGGRASPLHSHFTNSPHAFRPSAQKQLKL